MSVSGSTSSTNNPNGAPITFSGLVSGVDTSSIIQELLAIDQEPITAIQNQETAIQAKQTALNQLETAVQTFGSDASALALPSAFQVTVGASSDSSVATITSGPGAAAGTYALTVSQLASAQKLASGPQSSVSTGLGLSGTFVVNGEAVQVSATDSLTSIAKAINSLGNGVTASVIDGGAGNAYLTLASNSTGAANAIQLSDVTGGVLSSLGVVAGAASVRDPITNGALGYTFASSTAQLGGEMGFQSPPQGSFTVNGVAVNADLSTNSLQDVVNSINAAGAGVTASIVTSTGASGATLYQLSIVGASGTPTFTDPNGILGSLGVLQSAPGDQLVAANDANYSLDGVNLTSASNTITSVVPGATISLLSAGTPSAPLSATLTLSTDTSTIDAQVSQFVTDYNAVSTYITQNTQLDPTTYATGPLFADFTTEQVQAQLSDSLFNNVPGLTGNYTNLSSLGFSLDSNNQLQLNQATFDAALASNPSQVSAIFAATGSSTSSQLSYVSSTSATVSNGQPYPVSITQAATQSSYTAETAQTGASTSAEQLTFSGALFGANPYSIILNAGNTLQDTVNQINADPVIGKYLAASIDGSGALQLTSLGFGSASAFTATSDMAASGVDSGIGNDGLGTAVAGMDVAGTINGETATGNGQFLSGATGNATTDGLQIRYSGSSTGLVGSITYSQGVASLLSDTVSNMTSSAGGLFKAASDAETQQLSDMDAQIAQLQAEVANQQTLLQQEFANMETAIANWKAQGNQLSSILGTSTSTSTSSSTGTGSTLG